MEGVNADGRLERRLQSAHAGARSTATRPCVGSRELARRLGGPHMRRIALVTALVIGSVIGFSVPVSGLGLVSVTLTCSDGTSVTMNVDTDTLNSLTDAVNAMTLYPAGLNCSLVQNPLTVRFGNFASAASNAFIVGGGRWEVDCSSVP